ADGGAEILVHIGLETVALSGVGFTARVAQGQKVKAGDPLIEFDLEFLASRVKSLISPVILTNGDAFRIVRRHQNRAAKAGEPLMELEPLAAAKGTSTSAGAAVTRELTVGAAHGLHARPAAQVSAAARRFDADITLSVAGRKASAKSAVALMALGVRCNDRVTLTASGGDAREAIDAVAPVIEAKGEETLVAATQPAAESRRQMKDALCGIGAAPGIALGCAAHLRVADLPVEEAGAGIAHETSELRRAQAEVRSRLERLAASGDRARRDILSAHVALLDDEALTHAALALIETNKSAAFAWRKAVRGAAEALEKIADERMRERAGDLIDLERQVIAALGGNAPRPAVAIPERAILIADEILPSDLAGLEASRLAGLVMARGGPTSHVAIMAAGMGLPALVGAGRGVLGIADGTQVLLDADAGVLYLKPDQILIGKANEAAAAAAERKARVLSHAGRDCRTADGTRIEVFANLGKGADEAAAAVGLGAEGCGVLRTEFLFMDRTAPPGEDEQYAAYKAIAEALGGRPFILRTFDFGGDKPVPYLSFPPEENPALGIRGIRGAALWPDLVRTQLRAAVRAGSSIMLPMITARDEIAAARATVAAICRELSLPEPRLGAMIETPSSALLADQLVQEADFLSIGTNDLTQYTLAIDRGHRLLAGRLDGLHPAVLRLVARTADAANAAGKPVAVCGGIAADPLAAPLLVGLGVGELSVPAPVIPNLKAAIAGLRIGECRALAREALALDSAAAVRALVRARFSKEA
ncbi:MAG TPA: phosphoenolpyruvate--protein phosphotransferase, partial [Rhizomicrobium sp.]|nr:phosphoenolpyruvate--protein phosphotransferase [Rhizomicrobium sp.]